jgi:hypothetical protein
MEEYILPDGQARIFAGAIGGGFAVLENDLKMYSRYSTGSSPLLYSTSDKLNLRAIPNTEYTTEAIAKMITPFSLQALSIYDTLGP